MLKWIGRIIFIMIVSLLSLQVYSYATYTKMQNYYEENVAPYIDESSTYLHGINTLMGIDYYRESPLLYEFIQDEGDYQITLRIYAIGISANKEHYDGLMIFVNNVRVSHNGEQLINPALRISVELDLDTLFIGDEFTNRGIIFYDPDQPFAFFNIPVLFLFDADKYLKVIGEDTFANINRIEVKYSNGSKDDDGNLIYSEMPLLLSTAKPTAEGAHNKDDSFAIDVDLYRLRHQFANSQPNDSEIAAFNLITDRGDLGPYNWIVWRTMILYVLAVAFITYFLFFHKLVMERYREKRYLRRKQGKEVLEVETIFKDNKPEEKR